MRVPHGLSMAYFYNNSNKNYGPTIRPTALSGNVVALSNDEVVVQLTIKKKKFDMQVELGRVGLVFGLIQAPPKSYFVIK